MTPAAPQPVAHFDRPAMAQRYTSDRRYEWRISVAVGGSDLSLCGTGVDSTTALSDVFTEWVQTCTDLATWDEATRFGSIIAQYSELQPDEIAARLGIPPGDMDQSVARHGLPGHGRDLTWYFHGPNGNRMVLDRSIDD